jgi:hypothetical protein
VRVYNSVASSVTNDVGGTIIASRYGGVYVGTSGTVVNYGVITGATTDQFHVGVLLENGGTVVNGVTGTITGGQGIQVTGAATVVNAGVINSGKSTYDAVHLANGGLDRLIVDPGASFSGAVYGGYGVLELASAASAGTLTATHFTNFATIAFDAGAQWTLAGNTAALNGTIVGFGTADMIDLTGFAATKDTYTSHGLVLTNASNSHTTLHMSGGGLTTASFHIGTDGSGGTDVTIACLAAGTRIATPSGTVAVEALRAGDLVVSAFGGTVAVKWIGFRDVACRRHPRPRDVMPVRVRTGAFGPGLPSRDLLLSPDHALHLRDALIPARLLVNGATVVQEDVEHITYYHVELPTHDVLLAEDLPVETYLDTGNRSAFANGGAAVALHPDFALRIWQTEACAPIVVDGPILAAARADLHRETLAAGFTQVAEPALDLLIDGDPVPCRRQDDTYRFILPAGTCTGRLVSRRFQPARLGPDSDDDRELGVAVLALALDGTAADLSGPILGAGWLMPEPGLRWTGGDAAIALAGVRELAVTIGRIGIYWQPPAPSVSRIAAHART